MSPQNLTIEEKIRLFNGDGSWKTFSANGKLPFIFMSDGPHGLRKQDAENYADLNKSNVATCFPTASCIASSWDINAASKLGEAIATEALAEKVQLMLGPGMNLKRSPLCGRNFEYFSEDPHLAGRLAAAYVKGMQSKGVGSCIKHFACNNQEKRRQTSSSNMDEKTLQDLYLRAFEYVIKSAQPAAIMCSYNRINGVYAGASRHLLTELLREDWGYKGAVISDWGACIGAADCVKAGMDLAMPDSRGYFDRQLLQAYKNGELSEADIDKANGRVLQMVENLKKSQTCEDGGQPPHKVDYAAQNKIALQLAEQSAVLLKNEGLLPLKPQAVTVIGDMAQNMKFQGGGSSHITIIPQPNALETLRTAGFDVHYHKDASTIDSSLTEPVLFFCGLTEAYEGEGFDRTTLELPEDQIKQLEKILSVTKKVVVISFSGAPVNLQPAQNASAILHMYLCGQACGQAVANLLTGRTNPSGHLAETWPLSIEDTPCEKTFAPDSDDVNYTEGMFIGYRWYNSKNIAVQFPFGYGLSYTTFVQTVNTPELKVVCENKVTKIIAQKGTPEARVTVTNTGNADGAEVVQVYMDGDCNVPELCGFTKIFLKAGEEQTVTIPLENYVPKIPKAYSDAVPVAADYHNPLLDKTEYTISDSLQDMSKASLRIRLFTKLMKKLIVLTSHKSADDPSVKITISAFLENPLESLISTSGGIITEKFARKLVRRANHNKKHN